jgi:AmmeMemoRadiSam system protein B
MTKTTGTPFRGVASRERGPARSSLAVSVLLALFPGAAVAVPPTLEEVRKEMAIPSSGDLRGQLDGVGFARTAEQMKKVFELSGAPPSPDRLGTAPAPGVAGAVCPHDDYLYAGRVYREVLPLVTAKTVVVVGVFHRFRKFDAKDVLVFDTYRAWRAPDGEVPVSPLREEVLARLPKSDAAADAAMHDSEHSVEALVAWLKHLRKDVEILPVIAPQMRWERLEELGERLGSALSSAAKARGLVLGQDLAVVVSADAIHYGADFRQVPFGDGGIDAYAKATARDVAMLRALGGPLEAAKARAFYETCVNPESPADYRVTWCGRFSIPLGLVTLSRLARDLGGPPLAAVPLVYATSVGAPELPVRGDGLGETAPANLYHFVGYPALAVAPAGSK